jgi:hypothetical protein
MKFFEKHLIKLYLIAGTLLAYSFYGPQLVDTIQESVDEKGLLFTLILALSLLVALPIIFAYVLGVLTIMLIPLLAFLNIFKENRDFTSLLVLIWVGLGTLSLLLSVFGNE